MNQFYTDPKNIVGDRIRLVDQESKHASKVLRKNVGDILYVTDGVGNRFQCQISEITKRDVVCTIQDRETEVRTKPHVTLILGLIKKRDRLEFAVEKSTELGVDRIIIFRGDYSEKGNVRMDRVEATVLSAMKQSLRLFLPQVDFSENLDQALSLIGEELTIIYADETKEGTKKPSNDADRTDRVSLVVGPEGGFSKKERELLARKGGFAFSLGNKRLRTETAAITIVDRYKNSLQ
ncbi:RsmE family RNA methyltransferase [Rhodohalobacter halophilus]|uniref:RsmE family RNA methyltransferase n=1 Tax=Rhodohalobacter halophilus TaxID=1812810 RepID=UPI00083FD5E1|nr:RsmE family RNA methyltransferase [Rhodohalobacter halophilus]